MCSYFCRNLITGVKVPLPEHLLSPFINFLYTGNLDINANNAVEVLEAVELLQLEGEHEVVREEVSKVLEVELNQCTSLEALFPLWDTAVTFSLNSLLDRLLEIVAARIQRWTLSEKDVQWINRLGWEEMHQVWKNKQGICLKCISWLCRYLGGTIFALNLREFCWTLF